MPDIIDPKTLPEMNDGEIKQLTRGRREEALRDYRLRTDLSEEKAEAVVRHQLNVLYPKDPTSDYNSVEGIRKYLTDLENLNRLFSDRSQAGYGRGERMEEFCVLGRFFLDTCGNCSPILEGAPAKRPNCPDVMTKDELWAFLGKDSHMSWSMGHPTPPHYVKCTVCNEPWTLANCHDIIPKDKHGEAPLAEFAGQKLGTVKKIPSLEGRVPHYIHRDILINVKREGKPDGNTDDGRPWFRVTDDHTILPDDVASLQVFTYTHDACYRTDLAKRTRAAMAEVFAKAGFPNVNLISIPNEYWGVNRDSGKPPYYADPWFHAQVGNGPIIKIGWRKRVINIDWSSAKKDLLHLFTGEEVTKDPHQIHAWGYEKAAEYLAKIIPALQS